MGALTQSGGGFDMLNAWGRWIVIAAMILGRVETLAVIALLNPDSWGRYSIRTKNTGNVGNESSESRW